MVPNTLNVTLKHLRRACETGALDDMSDGMLLERFALRGDETAFAALVRRHGPLVLGVCRRVLGHSHDAEDAFQATFLVLARKAGGLRWGELLAGWLHGVAHRVALKSRGNAARRARHEYEAAEFRACDTEEERTGDELREVIDEELKHLPAKFRHPLLLCYLQGKSREEAAEALGCSVGTVKGCLERGRAMLKTRLVRRGVTGSTAMLAAVVVEQTVPAGLLAATVQTAKTGVASSAVAILAQGALQGMLWPKCRTPLLLCLLAAGLLGAGFTWFGTGNAEPAPVAPPAAALAADPVAPAAADAPAQPDVAALAPATIPPAIDDEPTPPDDAPAPAPAAKKKKNNRRAQLTFSTGRTKIELSAGPEQGRQGFGVQFSAQTPGRETGAQLSLRRGHLPRFSKSSSRRD